MRRTRDRESVQVAFLGAGYIADWHARALRAVPAARLAAVCDVNLARAQSFGQRHGAPRVHASLEEMLADGDLKLDVVHVLLPPDMHVGATLTLIDRGLHAFVEKPLATTAEACDDLVGRAHAGGARVGVNHNFLFAPAYEALRADLRAGILGRPDHIAITWHRGLDQLRSGPFDLWMLRDPENIMLEVGPHCLAPVLDLAGPLELTAVRASNPLNLPGGALFYRRWSIQAGAGPIGATINISFAGGFTEQTIHVRGTLASATADLERDVYTLHQHTRHGMDFDRYHTVCREAGAMKAQARRTLGRYVLSKLKLAKEGNPYGVSIARAVAAFHGGLGSTTDSRLSPEFGRDVIALCAQVGRMGVGDRACAPAVPAAAPLPVVATETAPVETLILGATGFIGQELARQLVAEGRRIRVLVRNPSRLPPELHAPQVEIARGDLARLEDLEKAIAGCRFVFHLARANVKTWPEFREQDIEVTRRVAEACLAAGVQRLIYTGTIDCYYAGARAGVITETTPLDPHIAWRNLYARAKAAAEAVLQELHRERRLPVVIFRPGIVIGRGSSPFHWGIGMWSWDAVCQVWGQGRHPLPLVLVEDVARALIAAVDARDIEGESFNLVADCDLSALDYLQALEEHAGVSFQKFPTPPWKLYAGDLAKWLVKQAVRHPDERKPSYRDWESRTQRARYDCTKARKMLNWSPISDRDEMIRRGIQVPASEWFR